MFPRHGFSFPGAKSSSFYLVSWVKLEWSEIPSFTANKQRKKSVSYFALDGGATELYIMSKSRVNDTLISVKKKLFVLCFECRGKAKDTTWGGQVRVSGLFYSVASTKTRNSMVDFPFSFFIIKI